jgi:acyl carrier protein
MSDLSQQVRDFVVENFLFGREEGLTEESSFLEEGIIDSTGVLELVAFLEKTFAIVVEDAELTPENLDSITAVCAYLERKQRRPA